MALVYCHLQRRQVHVLLSLFAFLLLTACGGLAGEPRIVATLPPPTPAPQEVGYPQTPPDLALGARIFAERCTSCHGPSGRGDGPLIGNGEGQIQQGPPDFTDPATTAAMTPQDWFNIITNGRIDKLMPPWRDALNEHERWAVTLYTYTMHYDANQIDQGEVLLATQNITAAQLPPQSDLVRWTDSDLVANVAQNAGEQAAAFASTLDESQRQAAAAFLRTRAVVNADVIGQAIAQQPTAQQPAVTQEAAADRPSSTEEAPVAASISLTITGKVTNGTAGSVVPPDLIVTLHEFDDQFNDQPRETSISADGTFTFPDVEIRADRTYLATTDYQQRIFGSDFVPGDPVLTSLDLPITIYEPTSDPSVVQVKGIVIQAIAQAGNLQVAQVFSFTNTSDRVYSTDQNYGENAYGSVSVPLPPGAQLMDSGSQQRYVIADDGSAVIDTSPVLPGQDHIVHLLYNLPYSDGIQVEQTLDYAVEGPVRLLLSPTSATVRSDQLPSLGAETLRNITYQSYGATLSLPPKQPIRFQISGVPQGSAASAIPANSLIPILLVAIGGVAIVAAAFLYWRGRSVPQPAASASAEDRLLTDGLIRQIAELDDLYATGSIDEGTYQKRRRRLKTRLAELIDKE